MSVRRGFLLALLVLFPSPGDAESSEMIRVGEHLARIHDLLAQTWDAYARGDRESAFRLARSAYLDHFEFVEVPLRLVDASFTLDMEYRFAHLRSQIRSGASPAEVRRLIAALDRDLIQVAKWLEEPGMVAPFFAALASFAILFREGIEALLILSVLLAFLRNHDPRLRRPLIWGAAAALPAGLLTWGGLVTFLRATGVARETLEGVMALLAAGILVYVSLWILRRMDLRYWMEFLRAKAWEAASLGSASALAGLGFLSVYREAVETALFYQALGWMTRGMALWLWIGAGVALIALLLSGWGILVLGMRLPLRLFLGTATAVVMVVSLGIVGNAVRAFQSAGILPFTPWSGPFPPLNPFVADLLGLYPLRESLMAQGGLLLIYVLSGFWLLLRKKTKVGATPSGEKITHADRG